MMSSGISQPQEWSCCPVWRWSSRYFCTCCQVAAGEQTSSGLRFCWRWAADCSLCITLHDGWSSWYEHSLFIMRLKMAVLSSDLTARLSWCLGVQSWCEQQGVSTQPWGAPVLNTNIEEVWLSIWTLWGLFVRQSTIQSVVLKPRVIRFPISLVKGSSHTCKDFALITGDTLV